MADNPNNVSISEIDEMLREAFAKESNAVPIVKTAYDVAYELEEPERSKRLNQLINADTGFNLKLKR